MSVVLGPKFNFSFLFILLGPFPMFCQNKAVAGVFVAWLSSHDFSACLLRI